MKYTLKVVRRWLPAGSGVGGSFGGCRLEAAGGAGMEVGGTVDEGFRT